MTTQAYVKMGKNMQGVLMFWIYMGRTDNGMPVPTKRNPIRMFPVPTSSKTK